MHENQSPYSRCRDGAGIIDFSFRIVGLFIRHINVKANIAGFGIAGNFFLDDHVCRE